MEEPPGGPPDFAAPVLVEIKPDSGSVVDGFDDDLIIQFNETIDERSGGGLENLVVLSPRPERIRVSWRRSAIRVKPREGWAPGVVFQMTLLPGVADLRSNRTDSTWTVIFSTGGPIPDTRINGTVINWEEGRAGSGALVEATLLADSLVYFAQADSAGDFELVSLPRGDYTVSATIDRNNNRLRDPSEWFDSVLTRIDSVHAFDFWAFDHDTTGPVVRDVTEIDSLTFRIDFTQMLAPGSPSDTVLDLLAVPDTARGILDSTVVAFSAIWSQLAYDSVAARERVISDSLRALADSVAADTMVADTAAQETPDTVQAAAVDPAPPDSLLPDTTRAERILGERPTLSASWFVRFASSVPPGSRYLVRARAQNVSGATAESEGLLLIAERSDSLP